MQAKHELMRLKDKLQRQIAVLESEMATVDKAIQLLERETSPGVNGLHKDKRFAKAGLSDALRQIVGSEWISPAEARDQMLDGGFRAGSKAKLLSAVYATLKRLGTNELEGKKIDGKMKYRRRQLAAASIDTAA
jgi:hypothetical protein